MQILRRLFNFYLDASVHVALASFALIQVTAISFSISVPTELGWFLFFASIVCYNGMKYGVEAKKYILVTNQHQRHIQIFSALALCAAIYFGYFLSTKLYTAIAVLALFTVLYAIPVLPHAKSLRSLGGLKIFVVALVWAGATVVLPLMAARISFTSEVCWHTLQRFLWVLAWLIPFEIRDLRFDDPGLRTLPQRYGLSGAKNIGFGILVLNYLIYSVMQSVEIETLIISALLSLVTGVFIQYSQAKQSIYFASFWVESLPILWWVLLMLTLFL